MKTLLNKLRKFLSDLLLELDLKLLILAARLDPKDKELEDARSFAVQSGASKGFTDAPPAPYSFTTFKEGMASDSYTVRHDAAAKLVGWYVNQQGQPFVEDVVRAAEILLEDTDATSSDISLLMDIWQRQAAASNEQEYETAVKDESALLHRVTTTK